MQRLRGKRKRGRSEERSKEGRRGWSREKRRLKMTLESCTDKSHRTMWDVAKGLDFLPKCNRKLSEGFKQGGYVIYLKG